MNTDNIKSHIINTTICLASALTFCLTAICYFSSDGKSMPCNIESINREYCENIPIVGITNGCNQCFMNSVIQVLLSCPEFCQYLDDPRTIIENYETSNILRNILHQVKNSSNGSVVNITPFVSQLRMKYYGNTHEGGDDRWAFYDILEDLKKGSPIFKNYYTKNILLSNNIPLNHPNFEVIAVPIGISKDNTNLQNEFENRIKRSNMYENDQVALADDPIKFAFGKNIFIFIEKSNMSFSCDIPKYLEFTDVDGNIRHYKLVGATCSNSRHATSCIMTNDEKILHINDSRISVHDFEDAQERLLNGKGPYQAGFLNYREI